MASSQTVHVTVLPPIVEHLAVTAAAAAAAGGKGLPHPGGGGSGVQLPIVKYPDDENNTVRVKTGVYIYLFQ